MDTSIFSHINWLAVLVGGLAYFMLGAVWYSFLFQKAWIKAAAIDMNAADAKKGVAAIMFSSLIMMLIVSVGLALIIYRIGSGGWHTGLKVGLVAGICFSAMAISISYVYEKKPLALHLINGLYNITGAVIAAIIISIWP